MSINNFTFQKVVHSERGQASLRVSWPNPARVIGGITFPVADNVGEFSVTQVVRGDFGDIPIEPRDQDSFARKAGEVMTHDLKATCG